MTTSSITTASRCAGSTSIWIRYSSLPPVCIQVAGRKGGSASLSGGLVRAFQGMSPWLAANLCSIAGVEAADLPEHLSDSQWAALHESWLSWLERIESGETLLAADVTLRLDCILQGGTPGDVVYETYVLTMMIIMNDFIFR